MDDRTRLAHIDGLRGLAVLLMVLVHAAATWEPNLTGTWLILGAVVSAAGGLAAPLFVALLGWGMARKPLPFKKRLWRAGFLFLSQFAVNLSAPHLFTPWTPGVLSLMGILILLDPLWRSLIIRERAGSRHFFLAFIAVCGLTLFFASRQGPSQWLPRVSTESPMVLAEHLLLTGLYPLFPWVVFAWFGYTVASFEEASIRHHWFGRTALLGLSVSILVLVQSIHAGRPWALPTGDASLTFFPANAPFLVAAITGVSLLGWSAERVAWLQRVADLGRVSLTVYVLHFLPFAFFHAYDEAYRWNATFTGLMVVCYTTAWAIAGTGLYRRLSWFTLEAWMRRFEPS